jgi:phosphotriesterase-related protein
MIDGSIAGKVQTVRGLIEPGQLGITLAHEHLLVDLSPTYSPPTDPDGREFWEQPVSIETIGRIRHHSMPNRDNVILSDVLTAIDEINLYRQHGGESLVEATSVGIARDPCGLVRISRATGVNVVMGSGYYVDAAHPSDMDGRSEACIRDEILRDITEGAQGTAIRSGIIGELGCSWPLTANERKVLRASAGAQRMTGAALLIHPGRNEAAPLEILAVLEDAGADLGRTVMSHLDRTVFRRQTLLEIAESGCYLEWDLFGREESLYPFNPQISMPSDAKRIDDIAWTASRGHSRKILVSQDICSKFRLQRYGGHGYYYLLSQVVPRMRARGLSSKLLDDILVNNPRDVLTFVDPRS